MQRWFPHMLNPDFTHTHEVTWPPWAWTGALSGGQKSQRGRCVSYLQPVCPHQLLCGGGSMRDRDAGVAGDQYGGTGQDVRRHQTGRHGAKVGVKRGGGCRGSVDVGGEAGRDWEHGLQEQEKQKYRSCYLSKVCTLKPELFHKAHTCHASDEDRGRQLVWQNKQLLVLCQKTKRKKTKETTCFSFHIILL